MLRGEGGQVSYKRVLKDIHVEQNAMYWQKDDTNIQTRGLSNFEPEGNLTDQKEEFLPQFFWSGDCKRGR